jgi:hypothetical protein
VAGKRITPARHRLQRAAADCSDAQHTVRARVLACSLGTEYAHAKVSWWNMLYGQQIATLRGFATGYAESKQDASLVATHDILSCSSHAAWREAIYSGAALILLSAALSVMGPPCRNLPAVVRGWHLRRCGQQQEPGMPPLPVACKRGRLGSSCQDRPPGMCTLYRTMWRWQRACSTHSPCSCIDG